MDNKSIRLETYKVSPRGIIKMEQLDIHSRTQDYIDSVIKQKEIMGHVVIKLSLDSGK
jgi:hypothetical protein